MQSRLPGHPSTPSSAQQQQQQPRQQQQQQQQQQQRQDQDSSARLTERPHLASRTPDSLITEHSDAPSASQSHHRPFDQSPQQRGTAREVAEMHALSTTPETSSASAIKYTRTGRVSKATKGQRVHNCDECGKTYTRAEHLRRHKQNHKPGAFPCDFPGCARAFYREDLLLRHKARHNDPHDPPSRRQSLGSQGSARGGGGGAAGPAPVPAPGPYRPVPSDPSIVAPVPQPTAPGDGSGRQDASSRTPKRVPIPPHQLPFGSIPIPVGVTGDLVQLGVLWNRSSSVSPGVVNDYDYESPDDLATTFNNPSYVVRARHPSDASFLDYNQPHRASRSPGSVGSSTSYSNQLSFQPEYAPHLTCCANTHPYMYAFPAQQDIGGFSRVVSFRLVAETRDSMEQNDLRIPAAPTGSLGDDLDISGSSETQRYLSAYWWWVHELYPIIHKPTFDIESTSPLLRAAVLALGAQAIGEKTDLSNARVIHEKCLKALKKRTINQTHTHRVCDMQAIFLVEVYAVFKSRRPPLQFSRSFEEVYQLLCTDRSAFMPMSPSILVEAGDLEEDYDESSSLAILCRQRLLQACYVLEQQCNSLFGRSSAVSLSELTLSLPFPVAQRQWDSPMDCEDEHMDEPYFERTADAVSAAHSVSGPTSAPHDFFRSASMVSSFCNMTDDMSQCDSYQEYPLLAATEGSPRSKLTYHVSMLCMNTPVRDLLAVAGESWVMAEKLSTQAEYSAAQIKVRHWASERPSASLGLLGFPARIPAIQSALVHAQMILKITSKTSKSGLLFQEWAMYLAAIVVWARAYMLRDEHSRPHFSTSAQFGSNHSLAQLNHHALALISGVTAGTVKWEDARSALTWVKTRIELVDVPHVCGLNSGALDVLDKLVARGDEDDWA